MELDTNEERYQEQQAYNTGERVRQDEVTINLMTMVQMLNANINATRKELLEALATHEQTEMNEINALHEEIEELKTWKWRFAGGLGALIILGLVQVKNYYLLSKLGGAA